MGSRTEPALTKPYKSTSSAYKSLGGTRLILVNLVIRVILEIIRLEDSFACRKHVKLLPQISGKDRTKKPDITYTQVRET